MPDFTWGHTYAAGDAFLDLKAARTFARALNERLRAVRRMHLTEEPTGLPALAAIDLGGVATDYNPDLPPLDPCPIGVAFVDDGAIRVYTETVATIAGDAVTTDEGGSYTLWAGAVATPPGVGDPVLVRGSACYPTDYPGDLWNWWTVYALVEEMSAKFLDPLLVDPAGEGFAYVAPTLYDRAGFVDWTRVREREINRLDDAGTDGERARFVWSTVTSEADERLLGTRVMLRTAGTWEVDEDQTTPPDVATLTGRPEAGDIAGPWMLNELKAAVDAMEWTWLAGSLLEDLYRGGDLPTYEYEGVESDDFPTLADARGDAEAIWPAARSGVVDDVGGFGLIGAYAFQANDGGGFNWRGYLRSDTFAPTAPLPNHVPRTVDFHGLAVAPAATNVATFDALGTPLVQDAFALLDTVGPTDATPTVACATIGYPSAATLPPWPAGTGDQEARGWVLLAYFHVVRWSFAYTGSTP